MPPTNTINPTKEVGRVLSFFSGVAKLQGLPHVFLHEVLLNAAGKGVAVVIGFDADSVEAIFFKDSVDTSQPVFRSRRAFSIASAAALPGRVLNGLGRPQDGGGPLRGAALPIFAQAPQIIDREPVTRPLLTGVKVIDAALPLGRGQRELIIGDRKLGKSTLAIDTVVNQRHSHQPVHCVYVLVGQPEEQLKSLIRLFQNEHALAYTTIVGAFAEDTYASQYLAPFVGCAIGEHIRSQGRDALVVYDDLSKHAKVYRSIALLFERSPGREAYPGDVFSLHAGLLERAAQLSKKHGGGSLTALPIIETKEGDITSFIPTNLISITDGQIYLERGLFQKGFLPAVNVGLSVSRVGSQAQPESLKQVVGGIRIALSQYKELQKLTQLETTVSRRTRSKIHRGDLTLELLKQGKHVAVSWQEQVVLFWAVEQGLFDDLDPGQWHAFESLLLTVLRGKYQQLLGEITQGVADATAKKIKIFVEDIKHEFLDQRA